MSIQKVEIVKPYNEGEGWVAPVATLIGVGITVLLVWWTLAAWVPELGITYWQTILPVFAVRGLLGGIKPWRYVKIKGLVN